MSRSSSLTANDTRPIVVAVDDDFRARESIASLVESAGYAPVTFSSAEDFLGSRTLAAAAFVIADVRMPEMDGIELQRRIRMERPGLPVIFMSGNFRAEIGQRALDGGAVGFMSKPFDGVDLLYAIESGRPSQWRNSREK
jgi:FixJ family two-component response regulator